MALFTAHMPSAVPPLPADRTLCEGRGCPHQDTCHRRLWRPASLENASFIPTCVPYDAFPATYPLHTPVPQPAGSGE